MESSLVEKVKHEIQGFFNLPIDEKMKFSQVAGDIEGYGQLFVFSEEQKLDWVDLFYIVTSPPSIRHPRFIPNLPPSFRLTSSTPQNNYIRNYFIDGTQLPRHAGMP